MAEDPHLQHASTSLPTGTWKVDPHRSSVEFAAPNLRVRKVRGRVSGIHGVIDVQASGAATAAGTARADTIDTGNALRDRHLRSKAFLHAREYPEIELAVDEFGARDDHLHAVAKITIRGVEREVPLAVHVLPGSADQRELHLQATCSLDREDFGMRVSAFMVGRQIELQLNLHAARTD